MAELEAFPGHFDTVSGIACAGDDRFATSSSDGYVKVWSRRYRKILRGHKHWTLAISFSPDSAKLASANGDRTVKLWDVATGQVITTLEGHTSTVYAAAFLPDGKTLATAGIGGIKLWNLDTFKSSATMMTDGVVYSLAITPDGKTLFAGCSDAAVVTFDLSDVAKPVPGAKLMDHQGEVRCVTVAPNGKLFATGSTDNTVKIWDLSTRSVVQPLEAEEGSVFSIAFSPNGRFLASAHTEGLAKLWDVGTGKPVTTLRVNSGAVYAVAFTPDGRRLIAGGSDQKVSVWDISTPLEVAKENTDSSLFPIQGAKLLTLTLRGHSDIIWSLGVSPDGNTIASGSADTTVRLWRAATPEDVAQLGLQTPSR
jgi:dipeptidyl aminopeptidase/acylaminoacyl peptidase